MDGAEELDVLDAEERAARLGEVLDREADHRAQHEQRVDDHAGVAVRTRILRVEIEGDEAQRDGREQRVVAFVERPPPVVFEDLAVVKVLESVALSRTPARSSAVVEPLKISEPANGMITSEGRGMHADSIPISSTIPGYPAWEITAMTKRPRSSTRDVTIVIRDCKSYFCSVVP